MKKIVFTAVLVVLFLGALAGSKKFFRFIVRVSARPLPQVLVVGDSISIGYTPFVRRSLRGQIDVHHIGENARNSRNALAHIDEWLGKASWDLVVLHIGLHDLNQDPTVHTEIAEYGRNLALLVAKIRSSKAQVIVFNLSDVPDNSQSHSSRKIGLYNAEIARIMKQNRVVVWDMHGWSQIVNALRKKSHVVGEIHFSQEGYSFLGDLVAAAIRSDVFRNDSGKLSD